MRFASKLIISGVFLLSINCYALPIGFGVNQGEIKYNERISEKFNIYHDSRAPGEAAMVQRSLQALFPVYKDWFEVETSSNLPVIISMVSENASFANFITNAIELQTMGAGSRDLFWHEYTHTTMYKHLNNWLGPAGTLFHLPWMPAWFIEGLAEAMAISTGSDLQIALERTHALTGKWPSYDRLHSLYQNPYFFLEGYATSGAFVSWILKQGKAGQLPVLLNDFFHYSMPWWWPWASLPFNGFLPMDKSLENYSERTGEQLYTEYKKQAETYWRSRPKTTSLNKKQGRRIFYDSLSGTFTKDNNSYILLTDDNNDVSSYKMEFNKTSGWLTSTNKTKIKLPKNTGSLSFAQTNIGLFYVGIKKDIKNGLETDLLKLKKQNGDDLLVYESQGQIFKIIASKQKIIWLSLYHDKTSLCFKELDKLDKAAQCPIMRTQPQFLNYLGHTNHHQKEGIDIWLNETTQTLTGNKYSLVTWNSHSNEVNSKDYINQGRPLSVAFTENATWLLNAEYNGRTIRKLNTQQNCLNVAAISDVPLRIYSYDKKNVLLALYDNTKKSFLKLNPESLKTVDCYNIRDHISPILYAMNQNKIPPLEEALQSTDPWKQTSFNQKNSSPPPLNKTIPLDKAAVHIKKDGETFTITAEEARPSSPAKWRPRPVFLFPWVGANDPRGYQFGIVSVPLMDQMQNETVRATFLYGTPSNFPDTDITLTSTRFWPTLNLSAYRRQSWNGTFYHPLLKESRAIYMDDKGINFSASFPFRFIDSSFNLQLSIRRAELKKYIGPFYVREGILNEPQISISYSRKLHEIYWSNFISSRFTTEGLNENFDYNTLHLSSSLSKGIDLWDSSISLGLEGSRTRGKKRRALKEVYQPLRTFIPGSGGGYNQNSFSLLGSGSLFSSDYGDTQARSKFNWNIPIIKDIEKVIWILYLERLDFSMFVNYGGAWYEDKLKSSDLVLAHGYNLDLQLENKGVRFNVGIGGGQVIGRDVEIYIKTGFDAFF